MEVKYDFPWERQAMNGDPMPDELKLSDQCAYQAVAYLYARYKAKVIDRDAASREKKLIKRELERRKKSEAFDSKLTKYHVEVINRTESARAEYRKASSVEAAVEAAGRIVEAIDNVPIGIPQWKKADEREDVRE